MVDELRPPAPDRARRHDRIHREIAEQRRVFSPYVDLDRKWIDCNDLVDVVEHAAPIAAAVTERLRVPFDEQTLEREHDRIGIEWCAVVEPHVRAQVE